MGDEVSWVWVGFWVGQSCRGVALNFSPSPCLPCRQVVEYGSLLMLVECARQVRLAPGGPLC